MRIRHVGLLALLVSGLGLAISCATTDVGLATQVKARFAADDVVKASQIEVEAHDGVVTLRGNVDSEQAKARALELAMSTKGVTKVVDMISARTASGGGDSPDPTRSLGTVIDDAGITMNVKSRLLDDPLVKGLKIDVDTRDGVVFLTGTIGSDAEKEQAIKLARETADVRDVQANLTRKSN